MPPQMDYHCEEARVPSVCGDSLGPALSCMLVGDGAVGKTSMIVSYTTNGYPTEYQQTAFDVFSALVQVDGIPVRIQLMDTAGQAVHLCTWNQCFLFLICAQEEFDGFRSLSYAHSDVFILCFSVVNPTSFQNVTKKWVPEIRACNPSAPIVLVGTQSDLRLDVNVLIDLDRHRVRPVLGPRAQSLAEKICAADYVECSALTQKNLKEAFDIAIFAAIKHKARKAKKMRLSGRAKTFSKYGWKKFFCFV
ncbi:rho-related GTP-binding protein RhoV-like isoform X1 [Megalops cyprinoides]|uniref:rho-related GTP-binding protein RhoV-like isoform X1 n=1 Tax=Megalops cyprinoides TaxID=118141 RepID=UPI001863FDE3|nr:rho-related GTP-binding protein RhoV-like isoform X1 [Megalops cyprinoides]